MEIICLIAEGYSNNEIADQLCLSAHTVTTHRKNKAAILWEGEPGKGSTFKFTLPAAMPKEGAPKLELAGAQ